VSAATAPRRGRGKSAKNVELIEAAYDILARIAPASVRAVCYQLFNAKLIPDMGRNSTGRVSKQLTWARENGDIPWDWIVDETREIERRAGWDNPTQILESAVRRYRRDWWEQQEYRVIVASEKATVAGTIRPVTNDYGVGFVALHGYGSASLVHEIAELSTEDMRPLILLYVGDWDPSGMHMSEVDLSDRIWRYDGDAVVRRIALTQEDTANLGGALSFSARDKALDARYRWFVTRYGDRCWELDALDPNILRGRIEAAIHEYIDWDEWQRCRSVEAQERQSLHDVVASWKKALKETPS
jgi:hypothetical protein